jgi:hypothetical protein
MAGRLKLDAPTKADMGIRPFNDLAIEFQHEPQHTPCAAGCCGPKLMVKFRSGIFVPTTQRQGK